MSPVQAGYAATLLLLLDEEQGAALLRDLDGGEVEAIAAAMLKMEQVEPIALDHAAASFLHIAEGQGSIGSVATADVILRRAVGGGHAAMLTSRLSAPSPTARVPSLQWLDAGGLADALVGNHPQFVAAVLTIAPAELAVAALQRLPADTQPDLIRRVAAMGELSGDALADIEAHLAASIQKIGARDRFTPGGSAVASRLLSQTSRSTQARLLAALQADDAELSASLSENLFMFEDVVAMDSRSLQLVLREIDAEVLTTALRGSDPTMQDRLLTGLSQRAASAIRDDLAAPSSVRVADVQAARKHVVATARRLADTGVIEIGRDDDDA